jgi:glycosyltransferase involved in cell wall biosynthesis
MTLPAISIIMPVYNGSRFLERAWASVQRQTFQDWELLAVDDGSTDDSFQRLRRWAADEPRLRVQRLERNQGPAAARNVALREARAWMITYLDCDDEYYPDYLGQVHCWCTQGDLLLFSYDLRDDRKGSPTYGAVWTWEPRQRQNALASGKLAVPLGVAHRASWLKRVGPFNETLQYQEDMDLWKRLVAGGARVAFVPSKSGLYHIRLDSQARTDRPPQKRNPQRKAPRAAT